MNTKTWENMDDHAQSLHIFSYKSFKDLHPWFARKTHQRTPYSCEPGQDFLIEHEYELCGLDSVSTIQSRAALRETLKRSSIRRQFSNQNFCCVMSEDRRKSDIEELKEAMDEYLSKSAELMNSTAKIHQDIKSQHPSLTVSEFQAHSNPSTYSVQTKTSTENKYTKFYQFLLISIMIACIAIFISLIARFYELKRGHNYSYILYVLYL